MIIRFSADLARWPSFWPQVTQFRTWPRNHQDKHFEQDLWWLLKQITQMLSSMFGVNWPSGEELVQEKKQKNIFSRWLSWISDWNDFSYVWSISHPNASYHVWSQLAFRFRRRSEKIDFQDGGHGGHHGFPIGMILAIFNLQVTLMLPTKYRVYWRRDVGGVGF